ncbi:LPS export ABC transporter permease LptG [Thiogranum longum]|jgi:lipopolysaccharide export system permease protein
MGRLDRYIAGNLVTGWVLVWIVLSAIFTLLAFVEELEHIRGNYQLRQVSEFILYTLPQRSMDLFPVTALIGSLVALAGLNKNSEIIAIRASGVSLSRFFRSVAIPALALVITLYAVTEFVSSPLHQQAEARKTLILNQKANLLKGKGLWSNNNYRFFNVRTLRHSQVPTGIYYYEFAPDGKLIDFVFADRAKLRNDRRWELLDVEKKTLIGKQLQTSHISGLEMGPFWSREELPVLPLSIAGMTLTGLFEYSNYLQLTEQNSARVQQLFWQKVALPLTTGAMVLLATPIGARLGTQRSGVFGANLAIGAGVGILFYLASQLIHTGGLFAGLPPALVAFLPVTLVLGTAGALFYRMR